MSYNYIPILSINNWFRKLDLTGILTVHSQSLLFSSGICPYLSRKVKTELCCQVMCWISSVAE